MLPKNWKICIPMKTGNQRYPESLHCFSDDDDAVPTKNGALYYLALKENNVPASFFIYPSGGHGWGSRKDFKYNKEMLQDLEAWLQSF